MRLPVFATGAALASALALAAPAQAMTPDGTVTIHAKSANIGVGWSWGNGTLNYDHHTYSFSVKGLNVAAVGFSELTGHGHVYNLHHLHDFDGTYYESHGEVTVGKGIGGTLLVNGNGVQLRIEDVTKGAQLAGSASGIEIHLNH